MNVCLLVAQGRSGGQEGGGLAGRSIGVGCGVGGGSWLGRDTGSPGPLRLD